jgi:ATP-dependent protease HslVU (ClpYQ) peptidase subunit
MTCIVGLIHKGTVYMGGDSAAVGGYDTRRISQSKVFQTGAFLIGYTSSFRMGQLLQYDLHVDAQKTDMSDLDYMVTVFTEAVRALFKDRGFSIIENAQEAGGDFLVGYHGKLYHVSSDYAVLEYLDGYDATGCGTPYALGALAALPSTMKPKKRIRRALEISAAFSAGVSAPFTVLRGDA